MMHSLTSVCAHNYSSVQLSQYAPHGMSRGSGDLNRNSFARANIPREAHHIVRTGYNSVTVLQLVVTVQRAFTKVKADRHS
jgi:hypothetical protein